MTGVVAEVEFADVAIQVLRADVVIDAEDAALERREIALDGVGVPEPAAHVFLDRVIDRAMPAELAAHAGVVGGLVGHEVALAVELGGQDRAKRRGIEPRQHGTNGRGHRARQGP